MTTSKSDLKQNDEEISEKKHSKCNILSFGGGVFLAEFFGAALGGFAFFYYETEIGLNVWLVSLAFSIYSIYNAINDPLMGYMVDHPYKFWRKWGRRFPWIFSASIPWFFMIILIFSPPFVDPKENPWLIFFWLLIAVCLYDTFYTIFSVSYFALVPEKFRLDSERRTAQGYIGILGFIGMLVGFIIPSLIVSYGNKVSYAIMAWTSFFIGIIVFMCMIPGVREDTEKIDAYIQSEKKVANTSFLSIVKLVIKQKNFVIFVIVLFMNQVLMACLGSSIHYVVRYVLGETTDVALILYAGYFLGAFLGVPIWVKVGQRLKNNKKLLIILGLLLVLSQIPLLFIKLLGLMGTAIVIIPYGFSFSGFWTTLTITISADVFDDVIVNIKMRKESILAGIRAFFLRFAIVVQSIIFAIVHTLTNFTEGAPTQPLSAQWGILVHFALIPLICIFVAILIFWKWYDITPEKREKDIMQLKELKL